jgi:hypothetical protein
MGRFIEKATMHQTAIIGGRTVHGTELLLSAIEDAKVIAVQPGRSEGLTSTKDPYCTLIVQVDNTKRIRVVVSGEDMARFNEGDHIDAYVARLGVGTEFGKGDGYALRKLLLLVSSEHRAY